MYSFFIYRADLGTKLINLEAATDIRWISVDDLKQKIESEPFLFFTFVLEASKSMLFTGKFSGGNAMNLSELSFMNKFDPAHNTVKEFEHWIVTLREKQVTLGACIITLKRNIASMSDVNEEEAAELIRVFSWYEAKMKTLFGAQKFNYVVAMMKDNFVHYHAFPRYLEPINRYDIQWIDNDWPKVVSFKNVTIEREILNRIISDIQK